MPKTGDDGVGVEKANGRNVVYQVQIVKYIRLLSRDIRVSRKWHSIRNIFTFFYDIRNIYSNMLTECGGAADTNKNTHQK